MLPVLPLLGEEPPVVVDLLTAAFWLFRPSACRSCLLPHRHIMLLPLLLLLLLLLLLQLLCLHKGLPCPQVRHPRHRHRQHLSEPQACSISG